MGLFWKLLPPLAWFGSRWLFTLIIWDTNVIAGLLEIVTYLDKRDSGVSIAQRKKIIWFRIAFIRGRGNNIHAGFLELTLNELPLIQVIRQLLKRSKTQIYRTVFKILWQSW